MRQTIGMKLGAALGVALVALLLVGVQSYRATSRQITDARGVVRAQEVRGAIEALLADLHEAETLQRGYLLTGMPRYLESYEAAAKTVEPQLAHLRRITLDAAQQQRIRAMEPVIAERMARLTEGNTVRTEKGLEGAVQFAASGIGSTLMNRIRSMARDMQGAEDALLEKRTREAEDSARAAIHTIVYGIPVAVASVCLMGFVLTRNITRPLKAAALIAERMAAGDISEDVPATDRRDEVGMFLRAFGRMAAFQKEMARLAGQIASGNLCLQVAPQSERDTLGTAFAAMVANLRGLTAEMAEAVGVLGSASSQIVASTAQLAASATETAAAITETTATVEEVRQTAQVSSQKARSVAETAAAAAQVSAQGRKATEETTAGMKHIQQQMAAVADSMVRLSDQTQAIGQIIATVDDLAAQSNLLAVNAAIEAAKAGEQGKGFVVVAQEVRSLAEQSKQATAQVRTILNDVQKATGVAVMATEQGAKAVEAGVRQSAQAGESIQALALGVGESAQAATQIAASSQQQLVGVDQVAEAMNSIKQATAQNVAGARQMEVSARHLKDLGARLKELIGRYKV